MTLLSSGEISYHFTGLMIVFLLVEIYKGFKDKSLPVEGFGGWHSIRNDCFCNSFLQMSPSIGLLIALGCHVQQRPGEI